VQAKRIYFNSFVIILILALRVGKPWVLASHFRSFALWNMMPMQFKKLLSPLAAVAVCLGIVWVGWLVQPHQAAPDEGFITLTGQAITLKQLRGKPVLVVFWASDCPSCLKEIPELRSLYQRYHHQGLEIIAVAMAYDPPSEVVAVSRAMQLPYPVALDLNSAHAKAFGDVQLTPSTFLINPKGMIEKKITGLFDKDEMQATIEQFLKE